MYIHIFDIAHIHTNTASAIHHTSHVQMHLLPTRTDTYVHSEKAQAQTGIQRTLARVRPNDNAFPQSNILESVQVCDSQTQRDTSRWADVVPHIVSRIALYPIVSTLDETVIARLARDVLSGV